MQAPKRKAIIKKGWNATTAPPSLQTFETTTSTKKLAKCVAWLQTNFYRMLFEVVHDCSGPLAERTLAVIGIEAHAIQKRLPHVIG